eukprot:775007-Rhodomonas_salina.1
MTWSIWFSGLSQYGLATRCRVPIDSTDVAHCYATSVLAYHTSGAYVAQYCAMSRSDAGYLYEMTWGVAISLRTCYEMPSSERAKLAECKTSLRGLELADRSEVQHESQMSGTSSDIQPWR